MKLTSVTPFFYVDTQQVTINIKATYVKGFIRVCCGLQSPVSLNMSCSWHFRYLFGEEVNGVAFVVFGIINADNKKSIPRSLQRRQVRPPVHYLNIHAKKETGESCSITIFAIQHLNRLRMGREWPY